MNNLNTPPKLKSTQKAQKVLPGKPVKPETNQTQPKKADAPRILETILIEEISIDGMCGIY